MKKTDVIIPIKRPVSTKGLKQPLHLVIIKSSKYPLQVVPLPDDKNGPDFLTFVVPTEPDEWVKFKVEKRNTIKLNSPNINNNKIVSENVVGPRSIFEYVCYRLTAEKISDYRDEGCEYFMTSTNDVLLNDT